MALSLSPAAAAAPHGRLPDVIISAKGYASGVLETPHAVTVLGAEEIRRAVYPTPGDLLRGRSGLAVQSDGAWGMNPVIRGMKKEQILLMIDGIRMNSAQPYGAVASFVDLYQVERLEVVKHPVSVLYGAGAMGGAVNIVTRPLVYAAQPRLGGSVMGAATTVNDGLRSGLDLDVSGREQALSASYSGLSVGDYDTPRGPVFRSGFRRHAFHGKLGRRLGDDGAVRALLQHQTDLDVWYPGTREYQNVLLGNTTVRSPNQSRGLADIALARRFASGWSPKLRTNVYFQQFHRGFYIHSDTLGRDYAKALVDFKTYGGAAKIELAPVESNILLVGVDGWRTHARPEKTLCAAPTFTACTQSNPFERGRQWSVGVFAQDEIVLERLSLKAGARFDSVTTDAESMGTGASRRSGDLKSTDNLVSWSAGAVYRSHDLLRPFANVSMGYRAGDMRERFERTPRSDGFLHVGNPGIKPERMFTLEAGLKGGPGATRYSASVYGARIKDYIAGRATGAVDTPGTNRSIKATENLSRVDMSGVEFSVEQDLCRFGTGFLEGGFQRAENEEDDEPLESTPPGELSFGARWQPETGLSGEVRMRAVAGQNRVASLFSNGTENTTPGFATLDLTAGYRFGAASFLKGGELRISAVNLLNRFYREHLTAGVSAQEIAAPGRNLALSWRMSF
ncbi:MAG: TonB-dependent receptor [Elusimicrobiota bacterium]